ncbi:hypothetical protein BJY52DRAFT_1132468 [Lactarius psammicola]|nr:hypothetical protein BJY52DRAFT_1132468 [Lactarius psammicola]
MAELWRPPSSFRHLLSDCVRQLATTQVGLTVLGLVAVLVVITMRNPWRHVPPGPRVLPIIGNPF